MNPSYKNQFNHYMYLAVEDRKSANPYVGHVMSADWDPYFYEKESSSAVQPKEKDVEQVGAAFEEDTLIKSAVGKETKMTNDDAKAIQDVLTEAPKADTEKELNEVALDFEKEYSMMEKVGAASEEGTLIKPIVEKATEISNDDAKNIQNEKDVQIVVPFAASVRGF